MLRERANWKLPCSFIIADLGKVGNIEATSKNYVFSFGPFRLIPATRRLEKDGVPLGLGGRSLDLLILLVERAGEIVEKKDLLARAWPSMTIEDITLRAQMTRLKKSLGDGGREVTFIRNVPGQGYSFIAPVKLEAMAQVRQLDSTADQNASLIEGVLPPTNLRGSVSPIVGRETELAELQKILARSRLLTLTGLGGVGKTRLAIELGRHGSRIFGGGVWLVDLATLPPNAEVLGAIGAVLGLALVNPSEAIEVLATVLAKQPVLLILDKCEHIIRHLAIRIESLLARVPSLTIIATSEEPLRILAEQVYRLKPLSLPPAGDSAWAKYGATRLFIRLVEAAGGRLSPDPSASQIVGEICRRLDGIPLALELAATAVPRLGLSGLLASLSRPEFQPDLVPSIEKITMRHVMAWSYGLLDWEERLVFRRLARFAGGFSLAAASAVAGPGPSESWEIIDTIGQLIEKSLVTFEHGERPRYRMLDIVRNFAHEKLLESGEAVEIDERHACYFLEWLEAGFQSWETDPEAAWQAVHEPEIDNIRNALDWAFADAARASIAVAMTGYASRVLYYRHLQEAQRYTDLALNLLNPTIALPEAARLLTRAGALWASTDRERALLFYERAAGLYRASDDPELAIALSGVGVVSLAIGRYAEAKSALLESRDILLAAGINKKALLGVHSALGNLARNENDFDTARKHYEAAIGVARLINDTNYEGAIYQYRAELEFRSKNLEQAIEFGRYAVDCMRRASWPVFLAAALSNFTSYLLAAQRIQDARHCAGEAMALATDVGGFAVLISLLHWAFIGAMDGDLVAAAKLTGFVEAKFAAQSCERGFTELYIQEKLNTTLQMALPDPEIGAYKIEGSVWSEGEAVAFARQYIKVQATT